MYKILIADDPPLSRESIHNVISDRYPDSKVLEVADLGSSLALSLERDNLNMPGMHGLNVHNRVQAILSAGDIDFAAYLRR